MAGAVPYLACAVTFSYCERLVDPTWAKWQEVFYYMFLAFGGEVAADASTECGQAAICLLVIKCAPLFQIVNSDRATPRRHGHEIHRLGNDAILNRVCVFAAA